MSNLTQFKAIYSSGIFIPNPSTVTALSLIFEKVYLPNNIAFVKEFSKKYRIATLPSTADPKKIIIEYKGPDKDPGYFSDLTEEQYQACAEYIRLGFEFSRYYAQLFPEVFETQLFSDGKPYDTEQIQEDPPLWKATFKNGMSLSGHDAEIFPELINKGYLPVVSAWHNTEVSKAGFDKPTAKQLAALLAMKSVQLLFPQTKAVNSEIILEARSRLSDHLLPFWSAMLKLSIDLKGRIQNSKSSDEVLFEAQELVDTTVMPALIDLKTKMEKEKKDFFYRILSSVQRGLKLMVGNPPITQQQLLTNALILGSDVAMCAADSMKRIEALKDDAGLTFLLETDKMFTGEV